MFDQLFSGKSWYQSLTAWGIVGYGAIGTAQTLGLVPEGTTATLVEAVTSAQQTSAMAVSQASEIAGSLLDAVQNFSGFVLVPLGIRKAAGS